MKKNEFYEGMVTSLKFPNKGIVYVEDEDAYVQVKNTLPGQRVRFQLKKVKKKRPEGNLTEVLVPSEIEKAVPPCPHFSGRRSRRRTYRRDGHSRSGSRQ